MRIELYNHSHKTIWDGFVKKSKNGLFIFQRDYLEYHGERFKDHSLLIWNATNELVALLPANIQGNKLFSHDGLTYGGFVTGKDMKAPIMLAVFDSVLGYLKENSIESILYKTIPYINHCFPSEEDRYALFLLEAKLVRRNIFTVINMQNRLFLQERRKRGIKKAMNAGLTVKHTHEWDTYWQILEIVLRDKHNAKPTHTLSEIKKISANFPDAVKLYGCFKDDHMLAGVVIYESKQVARAQYIAITEQGKTLAALDLLFNYLLENIYTHKHYFDFANSDLNNGYLLNEGLINQKEGFGGRAVVHDHYEIFSDKWYPNKCSKVLC